MDEQREARETDPPRLNLLCGGFMPAGYWADDVARERRDRASRLAGLRRGITVCVLRPGYRLGKPLAGDNVVVGSRISARGQGSGVEGEMPQWMVYGVRDGLVVRVDLFESKREALEAAGLSESALD